MNTTTAHSHDAGDTQGGALSRFLDFAGAKGIYIALAIVFLWFGRMKFTAFEAEAIEGLVANSPFLSFLLDIFGRMGTSYLIGTIELVIAALLALRFVAPKLAAIGAAGAAATFAVTSTLFLTTPGVFMPEVGTLAISVVPGQFLLKDIALLAASLWALNDAMKASKV